MPIPLQLPDLGTGGEPVRLLTWLVEPGEHVDTGDPLAEFLIPGLTWDLTAPLSGTIVDLLPPGATPLTPGQFLARIIPDPA